MEDNVDDNIRFFPLIVACRTPDSLNAKRFRFPKNYLYIPYFFMIYVKVQPLQKSPCVPT